MVEQGVKIGILTWIELVSAIKELGNEKLLSIIEEGNKSGAINGYCVDAHIYVNTENEEKIKDYLFSFLTTIQKELLSEYVPTHNDETLRDKVVPKIKLYLAYNNAIPCDNYNKLQDGITLSPNAKKYADAGVIEHLTEPL